MTICFYIGKPCRYGQDAAIEEQMDCSQCPAYAVWKMMFDELHKPKPSE